MTGERAARPEYVRDVLSVMTTCGMYDYAGEWVYWVGMPAKSGVAGGVLAVLPGQLGIGVFSPRLDARGNSVRGVAVCRDLSADFNLHFLRVTALVALGDPRALHARGDRLEAPAAARPSGGCSTRSGRGRRSTSCRATSSSRGSRRSSGGSSRRAT